MSQTFTFVEDGNFLINQFPGVTGPDGIQLLFTVTGTNSGVLAVNTAPPGSALSLTNIPYLKGSLVEQAAGTAITASGLVYVSANQAARGDLYLVLNWTSGSTVVLVSTASIGGGGGGSGGEVPAADVTPGTFGANSGSLGDYAVPDDFTVADLRTTNGPVTDLSLSGSTSTIRGGSGTGSGTTQFVARSAAGQTAAFVVASGTTVRWGLQKGTDAE